MTQDLEIQYLPDPNPPMSVTMFVSGIAEINNQVHDFSSNLVEVRVSQKYAGLEIKMVVPFSSPLASAVFEAKNKE